MTCCILYNCSKAEYIEASKDFQNKCQSKAKELDKVMGPGWTSRMLEVFLKVVAGYGMVLGALMSQGVLSETHRKQYKDTFLTWNKSPEKDAVVRFKNVMAAKKDSDPEVDETPPHTPAL